MVKLIDIIILLGITSFLNIALFKICNFMIRGHIRDLIKNIFISIYKIIKI